MPTADWYRTTADRLDAIAAEIVDTVNTVDASWDNSVTIGGRITTTIDRAVTASIANATTIAGELYTRADECRNRAITCDDYTAALATYHANRAAYDTAVTNSQRDPASTAPLPTRPTAPTRPAPWADPST